MMSFTWHPKPPSAPLLVPAAGDPAGNRKAGDCDTLLGPSEDPSIYNEMMSLRIPMFDGAITPAFDIAPVGVTGVAVPEDADSARPVHGSGSDGVPFTGAHV